MSKKSISQIGKSKKISGKNMNKSINDFIFYTNEKGKVSKNKIIITIKTKEGEKRLKNIIIYLFIVGFVLGFRPLHYLIMLIFKIIDFIFL